MTVAGGSGDQPEQFYHYDRLQDELRAPPRPEGERRVHPFGRQGRPLDQGAITNLVLTERPATDQYGAEGNLFDRQRVTNIVTGV